MHYGKWEYEEYASESYNVFCALELTLIDLNIVSRDKQSTMEDAETYSAKLETIADNVKQGEYYDGVGDAERDRRIAFDNRETRGQVVKFRRKAERDTECS